MAGGIGSRFWPMSRSKFPKQFFDVLNTGKSLLQATFDRFQTIIPPENVFVVTNADYDELVKEHLPQIPVENILKEPVGRNTAPCIAYAAFKIHSRNPNAVIVATPADHLIKNEQSFVNDITLALNTCEQNEYILTLGIKPSRPDTGYGYIQYIDDAESLGYFKAKTFTEKPELELAKTFLKSGEFVWNSGIFVFSSKVIVGSFNSFLPDMYELFYEIRDDYFTEKEDKAIETVYAACKNESIDYGIMEKAENVYVIPSDFDWSDLGTWESLYGELEKDYLDNAIVGKVLIQNGSNNLVWVKNKKKLVVLDGLEDFVVVDTDDVLILTKRSNVQKIKETVRNVKEKFGNDHV